MNVAFVNYYNFSSNSAIHIFNLANRLTDYRMECVVCVPSGAETVYALGRPRFRALSFPEVESGGLTFSDGQGPELIHAWTPRENVRRLTELLATRHDAPYVVHLEDNEDLITSDHLGVDVTELLGLDEAELDGLPGGFAHPKRSREFMARAAGITAVSEPLRDLAPEGASVEVISPAFEEGLFTPRPPDQELREALGVAPGDFVIVYAGNSHESNAAEMRSLYVAVDLLNRRRLTVKLVRLGTDYADFLGQLAELRGHEVAVGYQPRHQLPHFFALADVFVQPGRPGLFNDFRLPSKLPEFFAMGRPVVLPESNLGHEVVDGVNAVVLSEGHAIEIADKVETLLRDDVLRRRIGEAGRRFAEERFSWERSAVRLAGLYERVRRSTPISATSHGLPASHSLESLRSRYAGLQIPRVGYATVRDYVDSQEHVSSLACLNGDLKDVQRPWAVKAIVSAVAPGGKLLEIGAGEPYVASLLDRLGYDVWVVDPYDGRDGGPSDFDAIRSRHAGIHFIRGLFPDALSDELEATFDCVYSISVLEHVPLERVDWVCSGVRHFLYSEGTTVHAIDHVYKGRGAEEHLTKLHLILAGFGLNADELREALAQLDDDAETYFLSAESHNLWRGSTPYDAFPMRRCVSIQVCVPWDAAFATVLG
jgi:glycosyltransferase involved in cell wall biosynthesis